MRDCCAFGRSKPNDLSCWHQPRARKSNFFWSSSTTFADASRSFTTFRSKVRGWGRGTTLFVASETLQVIRYIVTNNACKLTLLSVQVPRDEMVTAIDENKCAGTELDSAEATPGSQDACSQTHPQEESICWSGFGDTPERSLVDSPAPDIVHKTSIWEDIASGFRFGQVVLM